MIRFSSFMAIMMFLGAMIDKNPDENAPAFIFLGCLFSLPLLYWLIMWWHDMNIVRKETMKKSAQEKYEKLEINMETLLSEYQMPVNELLDRCQVNLLKCEKAISQIDQCWEQYDFHIKSPSGWGITAAELLEKYKK